MSDSLIILPWRHDYKEERLHPEDKFPESLPEYFIQHYTKKGGKVFDPFAGHGTSCFVAENMGRIPFGMEHDRQRYEWFAGQLEHWQNIRHGDSCALKNYAELPKMDLVITSPPFMPRHHKWNPLSKGNPEKSGYQDYLKSMKKVFSNVKSVMKKRAQLIMQVDNLHHAKTFTPLIHDLTKCAEKFFIQTDRKIILWENAPENYPYTECIIFNPR